MFVYQSFHKKDQRIVLIYASQKNIDSWSGKMFRKNNLKKILPYFVAFAGLALSFVGLVFWTFFVSDIAIWICNLDDWRSCYEDQEVVEEILFGLALFVIMVFHLLLCYGFIKKRPNFVIPWTVLNIIFFAYFLGQVSNFNFAFFCRVFLLRRLWIVKYFVK